MARRPNILLIMTDNQSADYLGCAGNAELQTPNIDALAKRGTRFTNAYCVNAMCSPCRASVLTGLMPSQHGVHNWLDDTLMPKWPENWSAIGEFETLPSLLKSAGYATALIGKYHLGVPFKPQLGFDHWVTFPHGHTTSFYGNEIIDNDTCFLHEGHTVDAFTDKTVEYLETRQNGEEPFFAFVPFNGPYGHFPAIAGRPENQFAELYDDCPMDSVPREGLHSGVIDRLAQRLANSELREQFKGPLLLPNNLISLRNYFSQISLIDHGVGRIMAALDRLKMRDDTIVIFTSDHGFSLGHNGIWGHGLATWPSTTHRASFNIPLIIAGAGIAQENKVCDELVSQIDLFPTLTNLAQTDGTIELPSPANDLSPYLTGKRQNWPDAVFMEQEETRAIRTRDWLYMDRIIAPSHTLGPALYDLKADPEEKTNLADISEFQPIRLTLRGQLSAFFSVHSEETFDLWSGGTAKSNVSYTGLWKDAWGDEWSPQFQ